MVALGLMVLAVALRESLPDAAEIEAVARGGHR